MAYLDRKMEVKFRIEEKVKETHGGTRFVPPRVVIPRRGTELRPGKIQLQSYLAL